MAVLHVTNGEAAAGDLRPLGEVLTWDDVLHEGPLLPLPPPELRDVRARFLAEARFTDAGEARARLQRRDERLAAVDFSTKLVLWFEDDLYDQLQLVQILDRVGDRNGPTELVDLPRGRRRRTFLRHRLAGARPLGEPEVAVARRVWSALTSPDPRAVEHAWLSGTPGLPDLAPALERLLEEHPATTDGLARSERQLLRALASAPLAPHELFVAATAPEQRPFFGDTTLWWRASRLAPLIRRREDGRFEAGPDAARVLAGEADAVALLARLDRWVGGVHHDGVAAARWDPAARRVA
jgi:Domain of unknown function (DUF1835)